MPYTNAALALYGYGLPLSVLDQMCPGVKGAGRICTCLCCNPACPVARITVGVILPRRVCLPSTRLTHSLGCPLTQSQPTLTHPPTIPRPDSFTHPLMGRTATSQMPHGGTWVSWKDLGPSYSYLGGEVGAHTSICRYIYIMRENHRPFEFELAHLPASDICCQHAPSCALRVWTVVVLVPLPVVQWPSWYY